MAIVTIVVTFYLLIPGIGAFAVRARWRSFRRRMIEASLRPTAGYVQLRVDEQGSGYLGVYRCFATLEAIQGDDTLWIRDGRVSFAVSVADVPVYMLPSSLVRPATAADGLALPDEAPSVVPWAKVGSLPEGTRMFVCGPLYVSKSKAVFRSDGAARLTVVIYDGPEQTVLQRSIWSGRQRNEYWNPLTPVSLAGGSLSLIILASVYIASPWLRSAAIVAVLGSMIPVLSLGPPGVLLFFLYRRLWQRARFLRAERDLVRLPSRFRYDGDGRAQLPDGERYVRCAVAPDERPRLMQRGAQYRSAGVVKHPPPELICFGALSDDEQPGRPQDPLAEFVLVPGDPERIAHTCQRKARMLEAFSLAAFAVGLLANLYIALLIVNMVIH